MYKIQNVPRTPLTGPGGAEQKRKKKRTNSRETDPWKKYPKYTLDKDFLDYVKISQRDNNKYLVSLENYHLYKKKKGYRINGRK